MTPPVIVRYLNGKWQVMAVHPNGRQATIATYTAKYKATEHAHILSVARAAEFNDSVDAGTVRNLAFCAEDQGLMKLAEYAHALADEWDDFDVDRREAELRQLAQHVPAEEVT